MHCASDFAIFGNFYHGPSEPLEWKDALHSLAHVCVMGLALRFNVFFKLFKTSGFSRLDRRFNRAGVAVLVWGQFFKC